MAKLEIDDVVMSFGDVVAVDRASLTVADGETVVLLGPSGCGKTTLLRLIAGFYRPTSGAIRINGKTVASPTVMVPPEKRSLSMVFQSYAVWPHKTVFENLAYGLRLRRPRRQDDRRQGRGSARDRADGALRRALSERIVGRPAAARRGRACAGARAGNPPVRRAAEQSRRHAARAHALRDQGAARQAQDHRDLCHPRPERGDGDRRPRGGDESRQDRADRLARGCLLPLEDGFRRAVHRPRQCARR